MRSKACAFGAVFGAGFLVLTVGCGEVVTAAPGDSQHVKTPDLATPPRATTFTIVNTRHVPIYVDTDCNVPFDIIDDGVTKTAVVGWSEQTCEDAAKNAPPCCDCASAGTRIDPGGHADFEWPGVEFERVPMPGASASGGVCLASRVPGATSLEVSAHVFAHTTGDSLWPSVTDPIEAKQAFSYGDAKVEIRVK